MKAFVAVLIVALTCAVGVGLSDERPGTGGPEQIERGAALFEVYCSNCHGLSGKGDGPTAKILNTPPADLTLVAQRNGGEFPFAEVRRAIDGRDRVLGHGRHGMPIWGLAFQEWDKDTAQEEQVRARILQLTRYVESIQARGR